MKTVTLGWGLPTEVTFTENDLPILLDAKEKNKLNDTGIDFIMIKKIILTYNTLLVIISKLS